MKIEPKLLSAYSQGGNLCGICRQSEYPGSLTRISLERADRDGDAGELLGTIDISEIEEGLEMAIDLQVQVTAILTVEDLEAVHWAGEGKIEVDVVDKHLVARAVRPAGILDPGKTVRGRRRGAPRIEGFHGNLNTEGAEGLAVGVLAVLVGPRLWQQAQIIEARRDRRGEFPRVRLRVDLDHPGGGVTRVP